MDEIIIKTIKIKGCYGTDIFTEIIDLGSVEIEDGLIKPNFKTYPKYQYIEFLNDVIEIRLTKFLLYNFEGVDYLLSEWSTIDVNDVEAYHFLKIDSTYEIEEIVLAEIYSEENLLNHIRK